MRVLNFLEQRVVIGDEYSRVECARRERGAELMKSTL